MAQRTELHDALGDVERRCLRPEVVLAEEDRPIGPVDPDQPVRGVLDVTENGIRELVGEHEMVVVWSSVQLPVVGVDLAVALRTHQRAGTVVETQRDDPLIITVTDDRPSDIEAVTRELQASYAPVCSLTIATDCDPRTLVPDASALAP